MSLKSKLGKKLSLKHTFTFILLILLFSDCEKKNNELEKPILLEFPNCNLVEIDFIASYGITEKTLFDYENGKLINNIFFVDEIYNSTRVFDYSNDLIVMSSYDSTSNISKKLIELNFENGLLSNYKHFDNNSNNEEIYYEFDDNFNPFYRMPDFISDEYFNQNNVLRSIHKTNGEITKTFNYEYEYYENKLIKKTIDNFDQRTHTNDFKYDCK